MAEPELQLQKSNTVKMCWVFQIIILTYCWIPPLALSDKVSYSKESKFSQYQIKCMWNTFNLN